MWLTLKIWWIHPATRTVQYCKRDVFAQISVRMEGQLLTHLWRAFVNIFDPDSLLVGFKEESLFTQILECIYIWIAVWLGDYLVSDLGFYIYILWYRRLRLGRLGSWSGLETETIYCFTSVWRKPKCEILRHFEPHVCMYVIVLDIEVSKHRNVERKRCYPLFKWAGKRKPST